MQKNSPLLFALTAEARLGLPVPPTGFPESLGSTRNSIIRSTRSFLVPLFSKSKISQVVFKVLTSVFFKDSAFFLYSSESFSNANPLNFLMFFLRRVCLFPCILKRSLCKNFKSSFLKRLIEASTRGMSPRAVPEPSSNSIFAGSFLTSSSNLCTFLRSRLPEVSSGWSRSGTPFFLPFLSGFSSASSSSSSVQIN